MDQGQFYASKDNEYPTKSGGKRRINWGWATVPPASTQTLPREVTFNAATRQLQQYPIEELMNLRDKAASDKKGVHLDSDSSVDMQTTQIAKQSEIVANFELPSVAGKFSVVIGDGTTPAAVHVDRMMTGQDMPGADYNQTHYPPNTDPSVCQAACDADDKCDSWTYVIRGSPAGSGDCCLKTGNPCPKNSGTCTSGSKVAKDLQQCSSSTSTVVCEVDYTPPIDDDASYYEVPVSCGGKKDTLRLLPSEKSLEIRVFSDWTFLEAFFQQGRVAMVVNNAMSDNTDYSLTASVPMTADATVYPMKSIWVEPEEVRKQPRVYK
jgi:sucrose-6-phosphate hydrolase SacC (GH32 family)